MTWSFSRLHAYEQCPYSFYLRYIEKRLGESNFYAENGKCMHEVFESVFSGDTPIDDCTNLYLEKYDLICEQERESVMNSTFEKCLSYLSEMDDIDREKYDVLGTEIKLEFYLEKYKFIGVADLVVKNKNNGNIILIDHKQANHFLKKDGTPLKNQLENFLAYRNQMYLYCAGIEQQLEIVPNKIVWHHFKDGGATTVIPFTSDEYENTKQWAISLIEKIKNDDVFENVDSYTMCSSLCNYRNDCEYKDDSQ